MEDALGRGAVAALVHRNTPSNLPQLQVTDTLDGLWSLGRAARARLTGQVYAITGSSGKTTCKSFLRAALDGFAPAGNLNNFWGVPLSLARTPRTSAHAIYELGTNRVGEIAPLADLVKPEVAILLNVHPAHIGYFADFEELTKEKLSINIGLDDLSKFVCEESIALRAGLFDRCLTFGVQRSASVRVTDVSGDRATLRTPTGTFSARVPGGGAHRAQTLAAVLAALIAANRPLDSALDLSADLVPAGRGNEQLIAGQSGEHWILVDDSYNANPASVAAALDALDWRGNPATQFSAKCWSWAH